MADWKGFTDEDLRKLQSSNHPKHKVSQPKIVKPVSKKRPPSTKANQSIVIKKEAYCEKSNIPDAAMLSKPQSQSARSKSVTDPLNLTNEIVEPPSDKSDCVFDEEIIRKKEKLKLEDVQQRQQQMEEKNRRKKAMLTKEIAERKKKALAESSKLVKIQQELAKLDELLNFDVSILRDKIDEACMEFSYAQKRFNKAEAEYVAAKMNLHSKTTLKEDLTEHLFNLIQVNEERKARKLEELMHKLDVEETELEAKEQEVQNNELGQTEARQVPAAVGESRTTEIVPVSPAVDAITDNLHGGNATDT